MTAARVAPPPDRSSGPDDGPRVPGLRPPLPAWAPLAWFAALAAVLTLVVVALVRPPGSLDDVDPAYQRDGLLLTGPVVPSRSSGSSWAVVRSSCCSSASRRRRSSWPPGRPPSRKTLT